MEFRLIKDFFDRYRHLDKKQEDLKEQYKIILEGLGCTVWPTSIKLEGGKLFVKGHPALKQYLLINKSQIIEKFLQDFGRKVDDIV